MSLRLPGRQERVRETLAGFPWPESTAVSSGNENSTFRMDAMSVSKSPPGRSVRAIEPAKGVSPLTG
jgi:hypothetical protein